MDNTAARTHFRNKSLISNILVPQQRLHALLFLFLYSLLLLFIISSDSYTHYVHPRCDSAWFYMCGKAWMEGLTPYVDFSDSKGPLLWLIYGIGYLLSPQDFIGMFWLEVIFYAFTFYLIFLSACKLELSPKKGVAVSVLMSIAYFFPTTHTEMRAEDFCQLFFAVTLYCVISLCSSEYKVNSFRYSFWAGISLGLTVMIKYNIAAMLGIPMVFMWIYSWRDKQRLIRSLAGYASGFVTAILPFVIVLAIQDAFHAFIREYFINTYYTVQEINGYFGLLDGIKELLTPRILLPVAIPLAGIIASRWLPRRLYWLATLWFVACCVILAKLVKDYYFACLATFWFFGFVSAARWVGAHSRRRIPNILTAVLTILLITSITFLKTGETKKLIFNTDPQMTAEIDSLTYYLRQINKPKIIYHDSFEYGENVLSRALPGSKYWSIQVGASQDMMDEQMRDILSGKADFVVVGSSDTVMQGQLEGLGYRKLYSYHKFYATGVYHLYGK